MNNLTKSQASNKSGFTLIELMVVIAILAILAVVGFAIFNGQQKGARDARRRADIEAIANAMENNKAVPAATYTGLVATMFSGGVIPTDSGFGSAAYCWVNQQVAPASVGGVTSAGVACGTLTTPSGWTVVGPNNPGAVATWTVCAQLETNAPNLFCRSNVQT